MIAEIVLPYLTEKVLDSFFTKCKNKIDKVKFKKCIQNLEDEYRKFHPDIYDFICILLTDTRIIDEIILFSTNSDETKETIATKINDIINRILSRYSPKNNLFRVTPLQISDIKNFFNELYQLIFHTIVLPKDEELIKVINIIYMIRNEMFNHHESNMREFETRLFKKMKAEFGEIIDSLFADVSRFRTRCDEITSMNQITKSDIIYSRWLRMLSDECDIMLANELENHTGALPSALGNEYFAYINSDLWHKGVESKLKRILYCADDYCDKNSETLMLLKKYKFTENYCAIENDLSKYMTDLYNELYLEHSDMQKLKDQDYHEYIGYVNLKKAIKYFIHVQLKSSYNKCIFLTGKVGSGKTHFVYTILNEYIVKQSIQNIRVLFLIVKSNRLNCSFETLIIEKVKEMTGMHFENLDQLNHFFGDQRIKLVIVMDNFHHFIHMNVNHNLTKDIKDLITGTTRLHHLYWCILLRESNCDQTGLDDEFWIKYGTKPNETHRSSIPNQNLYIGGWLSIDACNDESDVSLHILSMMKENEYNYAELKNQLILNKFPYYILNPFTAWIMVELNKNVSNAANLVYIDFLKVFCRKRLLELNNIFQLLNTTNIPLNNYKIPQRTIELLANYFLDEMNTTYDMLDLFILIDHNLRIQVNGIASVALDTLINGNLLQRVKTVEQEQFYDHKNEQVQLDFTLFWSYCMANSLIDRYSNKNEVFEKLLEYIFTPGNKLCLNYVEEEMFEFVILMIDDFIFNDDRKENSWKRLFQTEYKARSVIWFAGTKANKNLLNFLANALIEREVNIDMTNIFAILYFLKQVPEEICPPHIKFKILQPYYGLIKECALVSYFISMARSILKNIDDMNMLFQSIQYFAFCESMGPDVTRLLADLSFQTLLRLEDHQISETMYRIMQFTEEYEKIIENSRNGNERFPNYFFQQFYCIACNLFIKTYMQKGYEMLKDLKWYDWEAVSTEKRIPKRWMMQSANLQYGYWYQDSLSREKNDFIDLVTKLSKSKQSIDMQNSFYMIKHTVTQNSKNPYRIHNRFIPILKELRKRPNQYLSSVLNRKENRIFIEFNIHNPTEKTFR